MFINLMSFLNFLYSVFYLLIPPCMRNPDSICWPYHFYYSICWILTIYTFIYLSTVFIYLYGILRSAIICAIWWMLIGYHTVDGGNIQTPSIRYKPLTPKVQCYCNLKCSSPNGRKKKLTSVLPTRALKHWDLGVRGFNIVHAAGFEYFVHLLYHGVYWHTWVWGFSYQQSATEKYI